MKRAIVLASYDSDRALPLAGMTISACDPAFDADHKKPAPVKDLFAVFPRALERA